MIEKGISSFPRFMYLNTYAYLLFFLGVGILFIPLWRISWWVWAILLIPSGICLKGCNSIMSGWPDKKRKYHILMQRNSDGFRPDTFKEMMEAPCGRLLVRLVLKDLGIPEKYKELQLYRPSLKEEWVHGICRRPRTVVKVYDLNGTLQKKIESDS